MPSAKTVKPSPAAKPRSSAKAKVKTEVPRQTAVITGASSGIGELLAGCFAGHGYNVILVARSADKLKALASDLACSHPVQATAMPSDLAKPGAAASLAKAMAQKKLSVDVLVNCAGVLEHGDYLSVGGTKHQQMIDLNISGLTAMLDAFLPGMVAQGSGKVLNVASIAAFQPIPMLATYAATKAYVLSLGEALAEELRGTGVTVTTLCPGITATHMLTQAASGDNNLSKLPGFLIADPHDVAIEAFEACMAGHAICVPGAVNQLTTLASRAMPKWLVRRMGGVAGRKSIKK